EASEAAGGGGAGGAGRSSAPHRYPPASAVRNAVRKVCDVAAVRSTSRRFAARLRNTASAEANSPPNTSRSGSASSAPTAADRVAGPEERGVGRRELRAQEEGRRGEPGGVPAHGGASPPSGPGRRRNEPDAAEERVEPPRRGAKQCIPGDPQRDGGAQHGES